MTAPPDKRKGQPDTYADVEVDLTLLVFRGLMPTMGIAIVSAVGLTGTLAVHYRDDFLAVWTVVTLIVSSTRAAIVRRFALLEAAHLTLKKARRCQAIYGGVTLFHCCILSVTVFHSVHSLPFEAEWLCTIGIFSVCLGLGSRTGMRPWVVQASGGILLSTLAVAIAHSEQHMRWGTVILLLFFIGQFSHTVQNQFAITVEQLRLRRKFRALSEQDVLTGLANRRHLESSLAELCAANAPFALLFIDLDRFKQVNDTYGHAAGDTLLIQVAERLARTIRPTDLLARLGGDEFAILQTPLLSAASAKALAARINTDIGEPFEIAGRDIHIGASVGVRLSEKGQTDADALLSKADQALYQVKQAGGGSFSLATA